MNKPTVGYGHLVKPSDNLKYGDYITQAQANKFFDEDAAFYFAEGERDARYFGLYNVNMIVAMASANYQLGSFKKKFYNTYERIKRHEWDSAIGALRGSLWASQTPVRVNDLVNALTIEKNREGV